MYVVFFYEYGWYVFGERKRCRLTSMTISSLLPYKLSNIYINIRKKKKRVNTFSYYNVRPILPHDELQQLTDLYSHLKWILVNV